MPKKIFFFLIIFIFLILLNNKNEINLDTLPETGTVTYVYDGDTIRIDNAYTVRYIGIDTPEFDSDPCFAQFSRNNNNTLVLGKKVTLVKDISDTDKYKRKLRYVYLPDGTFVNKLLVEQGYAKALHIPPDETYEKEFQQAEQTARSQTIGIWGTCQNNPK